MSERFPIGQLAKRLNLTAKTVRYYESLGLLVEPPRSESGYRLYSESDVERLRFVQNAKALGLSLDEIKEILDIWSGGVRPCSHVGGILDEKLQLLDHRIAELTRFRDALRKFKSEIDLRADVSDAPCAHIDAVAKGKWDLKAPETERPLRTL